MDRREECEKEELDFVQKHTEGEFVLCPRGWRRSGIPPWHHATHFILSASFLKVMAQFLSDFRVGGRFEGLLSDVKFNAVWWLLAFSWRELKVVGSCVVLSSGKCLSLDVTNKTGFQCRCLDQCCLCDVRTSAAQFGLVCSFCL